MSSPQASGDQGDAADEAPAEEAQSLASEEPETVVETVECPNCGHEFTGNYCPKCGQEANPSPSITGVIGGFFRELVDVESGFWPTFVGLTVRPGAVLRDYLNGVRAGLASPGRYLLATVLITLGVDRLLLWTGLESPEVRAYMEEEGIGKAFDEAVRRMDVILEAQGGIIMALVMIGPLAALLYRLFEEEIGQIAEALAVGCFLVAHGALLASGLGWAYQVPASLYAGHPVELPVFVGSVVYLGYIGTVSYKGFGSGWRSALRGLFAGAWSLVEALSVSVAGMMVYASWLVWSRPEQYGLTGPEIELSTGAIALVLLLSGLLCLLPIFIHVGVEAYYRWR